MGSEGKRANEYLGPGGYTLPWVLLIRATWSVYDWVALATHLTCALPCPTIIVILECDP